MTRGEEQAFSAVVMAMLLALYFWAEEWGIVVSILILIGVVSGFLVLRLACLLRDFLR